MTEKQPPPKEPAEYVQEEAEEQATDRELERDASKESVKEERRTGGALPHDRRAKANGTKEH